MTEFPERPGILRANACFLIAGAGLIILGLVSPVLVKAILSAGIELGQAELMCLLDALYYIPCVLVPVGLYALRRGGAGFRLGLVSVKQTFQCLLAAFLCVMLANSLAVMWSMLLEGMGLTLYSAEIVMNGEADLYKAIFAVAILPGICEELLFRGMVLGAYECGGTRKAILISSVLFATLHGSVQGLPVQLLIGIVLGFAVCSTGSLYVSMMIHTAYNAFILLISYMLRDVETPEYASVFESIGGVAGLVTVAIEFIVMAALLWLVLRSFARQGYGLGIVEEPERPLRMDGTTIIVLISGIVTVGYLYGEDIMMLLGYGV